MNQNCKKIVLTFILILTIFFTFSICHADSSFNYQSLAEKPDINNSNKYVFQALATSNSYSKAQQKAKNQSLFYLYNYLIKIANISYKDKDFDNFKNEIKPVIEFDITIIPSKEIFKVQSKIIIYKDVLTTFLEYYFFKQARLIEQKKLNSNTSELQKYYNAVLYFSEDNEEAQYYLNNIQYNN